VAAPRAFLDQEGDMAATVREIMNGELFSVGPDTLAGDARHGILALGITGAPVVDEHLRPLGMVSLRDLAGRDDKTPVYALMNVPAAVIGTTASIAEAGRRLAETGYHRLVAIDERQRAVGVVSALDVVRALLGRPVVHPRAFPHYDRETDLTWSDDTALELGRLDAAPEAPGLLVLLYGGAFVPERIVWAESCDDVRTRLRQMLTLPQEPALAAWLDQRPLRYRAAALADRRRRRRELERLWRRADPPRVPPTRPRRRPPASPSRAERC
jgi:CBS domain-containing protein